MPLLLLEPEKCVQCTHMDLDGRFRDPSLRGSQPLVVPVGLSCRDLANGEVSADRFCEFTQVGAVNARGLPGVDVFIFFVGQKSLDLTLQPYRGDRCRRELSRGANLPRPGESRDLVVGFEANERAFPCALEGEPENVPRR